MRVLIQSLFVVALPSAVALFVAGAIAPSRRLLALATGIGAGLAILASLLVVSMEEIRKATPPPTP
jgi:hypothetical protein